jgi:membrane protein implicated in regulation of membrane protease activity
MDHDVIGQIKREVSLYGQSLGEVGRLRLIRLISRVLGLFLLMFIVLLLVFALLSFGAVAIIDALTNHMPLWAAALILGVLYLLLIAVVIACRKPLFVHPFIKLMTKQIKSEEELALKIIEAEHAVDLQNTRMQCQIENATREWDFYVNLFSRLRDLIRKIFRKEK